MVEYDANSWLSVILGAPLGGGRISRCDTGTGVCEVVATDLMLPSAITFDKWGNLWLLEKNVVAPTVRMLD